MIPLLLALVAGAAELAPPDEPLVQALEEELVRNHAQLSLPNAPPVYHMRYHLVQLDQVDVVASFGSLVRTHRSPLHALGVEVRVGDPSFDNTGFGGWQNGFDRLGLPEVLTPEALRISAWRVTDHAYKQAVEQFARKRAQFTPPPDHPGDYTLTDPVTYTGPAGEIGDGDDLEALSQAVSEALAGGGPTPLERGALFVGHEAGTVWTVDSEGTRVRHPVQETTLRLVGHLRANDGMLLTDHRLWTVQHPADLPDQDTLTAEATALRDGLQALSAAPALDQEYVGPVIFEDTAAVDLFRYALLPQLEGTPPPVPFDSWFGQLGAGGSQARLSRRVLPMGWRVTDDPTRLPDHPGSYTHDWEGTPARAVQCVDDGIVRELLMSRVPRQDAQETNGHGRGFVGSRAEGRASLTMVEPGSRLSDARLRKAALKVARSYGRDWFLVIRRLQEPAVRNLAPNSRRIGMNRDHIELPPPVSVVRVYADGREEVLRGAAFASIDRWVLRDILGAGRQVQASYLAPLQSGYGALSPTEGMPSWISAPEVLVGEVELVPMPGDARDVPLLPPPLADSQGPG